MKLCEKVIGVQVAVFFDDNVTIDIFRLAADIRDEYKSLFINMPQTIPLPEDAPREVPRCIFQKPDQSAALTISLARMDYKAGLKQGVDWKNHMGVVVASFIRICELNKISIGRIGLIVETQGDEELIEKLSGKINVDEFNSCREKNISWVNQKNILNNVKINVFTNIQINLENLSMPVYVTIDANTHGQSYLEKNTDTLLKVSGCLFDEIEGKLNELF